MSPSGDEPDGDAPSSGDVPSGPPWEVCDEMEVLAEAVAPNLLLVVDRSGSMDEPIAVGSTTKKLDDTKDALNILLDQGEGEIRFGWMDFPGSTRCEPGTVSVDCADDSVASIRTIVNGLTARNGTPTGPTLENADAYSGLHETGRPGYVLLVTDGLPTCPAGSGMTPTDADATQALNAVQTLHDHGVDSFIIGLGEDLNHSNPDLLNDMALAGGHPRADTTKYYQANSATQLSQALEAIGGLVLGCLFVLDPAPQNPDELWVEFDGAVIPQDPNHTNGWDFDLNNNRMQFYGPKCDQLQAGAVLELEILMGCASEPPA